MRSEEYKMTMKYHLKCDNCNIDTQAYKGGTWRTNILYCRKCTKILDGTLAKECACGNRLEMLHMPKSGEKGIMKCPICEKESMHWELLEAYET